MEGKKKKSTIIIIVVILSIILLGSVLNKEKTSNETIEPHYINQYVWNIKDVQHFEMDFDIMKEQMNYVVLGCENKDGDLEAGNYEIRTNLEEGAGFNIYVTNNIYENPNDLDENENIGLVSSFDDSRINANLKKGQYLYLIQTTQKKGKAIVEKQ